MQAEAFWGIDGKESIVMTAEGDTIAECVSQLVAKVDQAATGGWWYPLRTWVDGQEIVLHHAEVLRKVFTWDESVVVAY
jgi:hypothetical protein